MASSITSSCLDSRRQRSSPDEMICIRASNRMPWTGSQRDSISETWSRPLSNHLLSPLAEQIIAHRIGAAIKQGARIFPLRCYHEEGWLGPSKIALIQIKCDALDELEQRLDPICNIGLAPALR